MTDKLLIDRELLERIANDIAYAIFNLADKKLSDLKPGIIETTDPADSGLIAERTIRAILAQPAAPAECEHCHGTGVIHGTPCGACAPADGEIDLSECRCGYGCPPREGCRYIEPPEHADGEAFCDGHCTWLDHHPDCVRAMPADGDAVEVFYDCREIGEGDWMPCDLRHYTYCQKQPEMDTRAFVLLHQHQRILAQRDAKLAGVVEALRSISKEDYEAPHDAADSEISRSKGLCVMRMRLIATAALAALEVGDE